MSLSDMLIPEYDHEMSNTRRVLERVPAEHLGWQPHPKSRSLGQLAGHLAALPALGTFFLTQDSLDIAALPTPPDPGSTQEILDAFDQNVARLRELIAQTDDATLMQPWTLKNGGQVVMTLPRLAVLRGSLLNHSIHHRGQLTVYLRLNDRPLPAIYGPTADEAM
jgi:uncharacterized damage-inducible protein DinB